MFRKIHIQFKAAFTLQPCCSLTNSVKSVYCVKLCFVLFAAAQFTNCYYLLIWNSFKCLLFRHFLHSWKRLRAALTPCVIVDALQRLNTINLLLCCLWCPCSCDALHKKRKSFHKSIVLQVYAAFYFLSYWSYYRIT